MNSAPRHRSITIIAFAVSLFLGLTLTPPGGDSASALLASLREHVTLANLTALFRTLAAVLVVVTLAAIAPSITRRGSRAFRLSTVLLLLGNLAGIVVFTLMILQSSVLGPLPDRTAAIAVAEAIEKSMLWQVATVIYLIGLLIGFLLLGVAAWRAGLGRLAAGAISAGLVVHVAGGDWFVTSMAGALILCGGLTSLGLWIAGAPQPVGAPSTADPARSLVSDQPVSHGH